MLYNIKKMIFPCIYHSRHPFARSFLNRNSESIKAGKEVLDKEGREGNQK